VGARQSGETARQLTPQHEPERRQPLSEKLMLRQRLEIGCDFDHKR
jgi:hypothetical protein